VGIDKKFIIVLYKLYTLHGAVVTFHITGSETETVGKATNFSR